MGVIRVGLELGFEGVNWVNEPVLLGGAIPNSTCDLSCAVGAVKSLTVFWYCSVGLVFYVAFFCVCLTLLKKSSLFVVMYCVSAFVVDNSRKLSMLSGNRWSSVSLMWFS